MMRSIHLFLLLFAGFFISGALTPSISENNPIEIGDVLNNKNSLVLSSRPWPALHVPDLGPTRLPARSLSSFHDNRKYDKYLAAGSDGTFSLRDSQSDIPLWTLVTGSPLLHSKKADSDLEYFVDYDEQGQLYEYSKSFGRRFLNCTLEELVHRAPVILDSTFTFGSKETSYLFLNETSGEVFSRQMPATAMQTKGQSLVEQKLVVSEPAVGDGYIMLVRTDYSLKSLSLPKDPTQISSDPSEPLWQLSRSHISAVHIKSGLPSNMSNVSPSRYQIDVRLTCPSRPPLINKGRVTENHMLPSMSQSYETHNYNQDTLMLPATPSVRQSIAETYQTPSGANKIQEQSDDFQNNVSEVALRCPVGDKVSSTEMSHESRKLQIEYGGEAWPNFTSVLQNLPKDSNTHLMERDYGAKQNFNKMPTGVSFGFILCCLVLFILFIPVCWHVYFKETSGYDGKSSNSTGRQSINPKKRKARKAGKNNSFVSNYEKVVSSDEKNADGNGLAHLQSNWLHSLQNYVSSPDGDGRWVGKLFVSNLEIGRGSNGTVVFEGLYDGRPVAVKRLLLAHNDVAFKEIQNLIASDKHPNIVRLYGVERDLDFVYISLERCSCSLSDLIHLCSDSSVDSADMESQTLVSTNEHKVPLIFEKGIEKDLELWRENGFPSPHLLKLMRDVVSGLAHLHELGIIHRDMKPQNVLISTDRSLKAKLSDMGISKRLLEDMSSLTHRATGSGTSGWQAPEQLLRGRQSRSVDLFSLGCILFFCITKGKHPFGNHIERDANIVKNHIDLFLVDHIPEAVDLLSQLFSPDPNMRPSAVDVYHHPFFWSSEMRLTFLRDTSDRVELEDRENGSELLEALESVAPVAFGGRWGEKLDAAFLTDMGRYRKYKFDCMRDLLRVIRNKLSHYRELSEELKEILGSVPEGFDSYFSSRFPNLLIQVYKVMRRYCSNEDDFSKYFQRSLV